METKGHVRGSLMEIVLLPIVAFGLNGAICENLQNIKAQWSPLTECKEMTWFSFLLFFTIISQHDNE